MARLARLSAVQAGARGTQVLQLNADVYSADHFADPLPYLQQKFPGAALVEDGGSQGVESDLFREKARELADAEQRARYKDDLEQKMNAITAANEGALAGPPLSQFRALAEVYGEIEKVTDFEEALRFLRENSLRMSNAGVPIERIAAGVKGAPQHVFHRDAGFVTIEPGALSGARKEQTKKAAALNGPEGKGWVQGHDAIENWGHRFVEHVHVDKGTGDAFEIYNGAEGKVTAAVTHGNKHMAVLAPDGKDKTAVADAYTTKKNKDLADAVEKEREPAVVDEGRDEEERGRGGRPARGRPRGGASKK